MYPRYNTNLAGIVYQNLMIKIDVDPKDGTSEAQMFAKSIQGLISVLGLNLRPCLWLVYAAIYQTSTDRVGITNLLPVFHRTKRLRNYRRLRSANLVPNLEISRHLDTIRTDALHATV